MRGECEVDEDIVRYREGWYDPTGVQKMQNKEEKEVSIFNDSQSMFVTGNGSLIFKIHIF